jgi:hypothetical protein
MTKIRRTEAPIIILNRNLAGLKTTPQDVEVEDINGQGTAQRTRKALRENRESQENPSSKESVRS